MPSYSGADGSRVFEALAKVELPFLLHAPGAVSTEFAPVSTAATGGRALAVHVPCPGHKEDLGVFFVGDNGPCFVAGATLADIEHEARQGARLILQRLRFAATDAQASIDGGFVTWQAAAAKRLHRTGQFQWRRMNDRAICLFV
jgi:hypothetical protein